MSGKGHVRFSPQAEVVEFVPDESEKLVPGPDDFEDDSDEEDLLDGDDFVERFWAMHMGADEPLQLSLTGLHLKVTSLCWVPSSGDDDAKKGSGKGKGKGGVAEGAVVFAESPQVGKAVVASLGPSCPNFATSLTFFEGDGMASFSMEGTGSVHLAGQVMIKASMLESDSDDSDDSDDDVGAAAGALDDSLGDADTESESDSDYDEDAAAADEAAEREKEAAEDAEGGEEDGEDHAEAFTTPSKAKKQKDSKKRGRDEEDGATEAGTVSPGSKGRKPVLHVTKQSRVAVSGGDDEENAKSSATSTPAAPLTKKELRRAEAAAKKAEAAAKKAEAVAKKQKELDDINADKKKTKKEKQKEKQKQKQLEKEKEKEKGKAKAGGAPDVVEPKQPRMVSLSNGLKFQEVVLGLGPKPTPGRKVKVMYVGKLTNGRVFDQSRKPFEFRLGVGQVIKGWDIGVASMRVGGKRKLIVPAKLAYGRAGIPGTIPPNATLEFDVHLLHA